MNSAVLWFRNPLVIWGMSQAEVLLGQVFDC